MKKRIFTGVLFFVSLFLFLISNVTNKPVSNNNLIYDGIEETEERKDYIENEWLLKVESYDEALEIAFDNGLILKSVSSHGVAVFYGDIGQITEPLYYKEKVEFQRNYLYYTQEVVINDPDSTNQFALEHLDAFRAWDYALGAGVLVAVIDTGIDLNHDEFVGKISSLSYNSFHELVGVEEVIDDVGHGTAVAGVITANQNNEIGISGIAPLAELLVIKANFDNEGSFSGDAIAEALYYATDNGADIINMSLGGAYADPIVEAACDYAYNAGVIVVAAAGNDGLPILSYPASYESVISVGATTYTKEKAQFSNYNREVDISAPGQDVLTTVMGNAYNHVSGTSFSSPYIAGVIALLKSYYLVETNEMILNYLYASADDLGTFGKDSLYGYGLANAYDAMTITLRAVNLETFLGSPIPTKYVAEGRPFYITDRPTLEGHYFAGWYKDQDLLDRFDFENEVIYSDITLYAKYEEGDSTFLDDYDFLVNSDDTVTILSYFGPGGVVNVPSEIYGLPVVEISSGAFVFNTDVTVLNIPDSVVTVGSFAFGYMDGVTEINIGSGLVNLGEAAFAGSPTLQTVSILSESLINIPNHCFESSVALHTVTLPDSITEFHTNAFYNTTSLTNINFPLSLKVIGENAFKNSGIPEAILPDGLEIIYSSAFAYAFNLSHVYFGESLWSIGQQVFLGCSLVDLVEVSVNNLNYTIDNNVLFSSDYTNLIWYLPYNTDITFTLPESVHNIYAAAFSNASFEYFEFNTAVSDIPDLAFYEATELIEIVIPDTIKSIGTEAFKRAYALTSVTFPKDLETISNGMFDRCISLKNVVFPENLRVIGGAAFVASGIEKIILPETVEILSDWAFAGCYFLKEIYVPDGVKEIGNIALSTVPIDQVYPNLEVLGLNGLAISLMEEVIFPESLTSLDYINTPGTYALTRKIDFGGAKDIVLDLNQGSRIQELIINETTETFLVEGMSSLKIHMYFYGMTTEVDIPISEIFVVHAYEGSVAHQYAIDNGLAFYSLTRDVINHSVTINIDGLASVVGDIPAFIQDQEMLHFELDVADNHMVYEIKVNGKNIINSNRSYWINVTEDIVIDVKIRPNDYLLEYDDFTVVDQIIVATSSNAERINYPGVDEALNPILGFLEINGRLEISYDLYQHNFGNNYFSSYDILHIGFPEGVTHIPFLDNVFRRLETVDIPEGVITMSGFEGLSKLKYLIFPTTLDVFPHWIDTNGYVRGAMTYCDSLEYVIFKSFNMDTIPDYAFYSAYSLKMVYTSDILAFIGDYAFYNAVSFEEIKFLGFDLEISESAFMFKDYAYYYMSISPYGDNYNKLPNLIISSLGPIGIDYAETYGIDYFAVKKYYVAYLNDDLTINYMETVNEYGNAVYGGIPKKSPEDNLMYVFIGWDYDLTGLTYSIITNPTFMSFPRAYTVTFVDPYTKEVIGVSNVYFGGAAIAPENTDRASNPKYSYEFLGWSEDFSNVTDDLVVEALYERTLVEYQVTFYDWDDEVLAVESVGYGQAATEPVLPPKDNYTFKEWSEDITYINKDLDVYPIREQRQFLVIFYDFYGNWVGQQEVFENDSAIPPDLGDISGYILIGWSEDIQNVTEPMSVYPIYAQSESRLTLITNEVEPIDIVSIRTNFQTTLILDANHNLYGIGINYYGIMGNDFLSEVDNPINITANLPLHDGEFIVSVFLGNTISLMVTSEDRILVSGNNSEGQLGIGEINYGFNSCVDITSSFSFEPGETIVDASLFDHHSIVLTNMERIFAWGNNEYGQLGTGDTTPRHVPTDVTASFSFESGETVVSLGTGICYTGLLTSLGKVYLWGFNGGQLADGTTDHHYLPNDVTMNFNLNPTEKIVSLKLSSGYGFALTSESRVFAWGGGYYGNLTTGNNENFDLPVDVTGNFGLIEQEVITNISLGHGHGYALTSNGRLFAWGLNTSGQLGVGLRFGKSSVIDITDSFIIGEDQIIMVEAGNYSGFVLTAQDKLYGFGGNNYGQLGIYSKYDSLSPVLVSFNNTNVETYTYNYGDDVTLIEPTRETENFAGWFYDYDYTLPIEADFDLDIDKVLYAKWEIKTFVVRFFNDDGSLIKEEIVEYGMDATAPIEPFKVPTAQYDFYFNGWSEDFSNVLADIDVYATYIEDLRYYEVNFYNFDDTLLKTEIVAYGGSATPPVDPTKPSTDQYDYVFGGWTGDYTSITGDMNFHALYTGIIKEFIVRYYDAEGVLIKEETVTYGQDSTPPEEPVKVSEIFYEYLFSHWSDVYTHITENKNIYPVFNPIAIIYTYSLDAGVDTIIQGEEWHDGGVVLGNDNLYFTVSGTVNNDVVGNYSITYTLKVEETIIGYLTRIVRVVDGFDEVDIVLNPGVSTLVKGDIYLEAGATTNYGTIVISGDVDTSQAGVYLITYRVDWHGKIYEKYRFVIVYDSGIDLNNINAIIPATYRKEDEE